MKIKKIIGIPFIACVVGCSSLSTSHEKAKPVYKEVNFASMSERERPFPALETDTNVVLEQVLASAKNTQLSEKEELLLSNYVEKTKLFCQKGFNQKWMNQLQSNLAFVEKTENNQIAPAINKKMQELFAAKQC